ncbi:hypothetical protein ET495_03015 [Xylanimonas allomyrinae]|uniref:Uncharacterized protein n=1 Tax=Xylanimonas allomyrinae TaxID=2509459 RepID=A0A4P6EQ47_9MICO|nr:hypothetical protein [Xylanimonas allomyrinae]QAY62397.1 hypothetical protein ET495_03015 [Xylanimonas allomyrinae]
MAARHDGIAYEQAEYVAGRGVLAIHNEVKAPHTLDSPTVDGGGLPRRTPRLGNSGLDGPPMT